MNRPVSVLWPGGSRGSSAARPDSTNRWECTPSQPAPDRWNTIVARPGRSNRVPSTANPVLVHGATTTAKLRSSATSTCVSLIVNRKSSVFGQTLSHCKFTHASKLWQHILVESRTPGCPDGTAVEPRHNPPRAHARKTSSSHATNHAFVSASASGSPIHAPYESANRRDRHSVARAITDVSAMNNTEEKNTHRGRS